MKNDDEYIWVSFVINQSALDFGVCNGFVYLINSKGEIWVNRLSSPANKIYERLNNNNDKNVYIKKGFTKIADLESFPLDSVSYGNKLCILTESGTFVLNLSTHTNRLNIQKYTDFKPISATKKNGILFFSFGEQGFIMHKPSFNNREYHQYHSASSQIIVNRDFALNLFPDTPIQVFKFNPYFRPKDRTFHHRYLPQILTPYEPLNLVFKDYGIFGRDIIAPYATPNKIVLTTLDRSTFFIESLPTAKDDVKLHLIPTNDSCHTKIAGKLLGYKLTTDEDYFPTTYNNIENDNEQPIARYFHPNGIIEEYWDRVLFESNSGKRFELVKDEEISEIRTYTDNKRYQSLITIATEKACHLIDIHNKT